MLRTTAFPLVGMVWKYLWPVHITPLCLHSNGNMYASDNGLDVRYGDMMTGCGPGEFKPDVTEGDKINIIY